MGRNFLILILLILFFSVEAEITMRIKLFSSQKSNRTIFTITKAEGYLIALQGDKIIDTITKLDSKSKTLKTIYMNIKNNQITVNKINKNLGVYDRLLVKSSSKESIYTINYNNKNRTYQGDFILFSKEKKYLEIINIIDIERYVSGVVESEGGHCFFPEYLKAQAILARTYALRNSNKYSEEEYNLTDDVRSQVYHSRAHLRHAKEIMKATEDTKGLIIYDTRGKVIDAVFHANSGGETVNPIYVWRTDGFDYLKPRNDKYSIGVDSYSWEKIISKARYLSFFKKKYPKLYDDNEFIKRMLCLKQGNKRKNIIRYKNYILKLSELRAFLKIRSTFFDVKDLGNGKILLKGKGFGHGIGLSQDGAINMAKQGIKFRDIIKYYYNNVIIDDYSKILN